MPKKIFWSLIISSDFSLKFNMLVNVKKSESFYETLQQKLKPITMLIVLELIFFLFLAEIIRVSDNKKLRFLSNSASFLGNYK